MIKAQKVEHWAKILLVVTKKMRSIGNVYPGRGLFLECSFTILQV